MSDVIIFSQRDDSTTNIVMQWLLYLNKKAIRINEEDNLVGFSTFHIPNDRNIDAVLNLNYGKKISLFEKDKKRIWFRRGSIKVTDGNIDLGLLNSENESRKIFIEHLTDEFNSLKNLVYSFVGDLEYSISNPLNYQVNKLTTLLQAKVIGLNIPETLVTCNKSDLSTFFEENPGGIITKGIQEICSIRIEKEIKSTFTVLINKDFLDKLPSYFQPSLFQQKIEKQLEIRTFFFIDSCYSMAIFSQNDSQTSLDFRRYNLTNPNRMVPYKLPNEIELKIKLLMKKLNLNTGSLDLLVDKNMNYFFLEVNPVGQFSFVSQNCNFNLEKIIASYL